MKGRILLLIAAFGLITALALPASAQGGGQNPRPGWQDRGHDRDDHDGNHDRYKDNRAYQDGLRDGQRDRGRQSHMGGSEWKGDDRRAYEAGYRDGYGGGVMGRPMGQNGERNRRDSQAFRNGYAEGLRYGQNDVRARQTRHANQKRYVRESHERLQQRFRQQGRVQARIS